MRSQADYNTCVLAEQNAFNTFMNGSRAKLFSTFTSSTSSKAVPGAPLSIACNALTRDMCGRKSVAVDPVKAYACADKIQQAHDIYTDPHATTSSSMQLENFLKRERCLEKSRLGYFRCAEFLQRACDETNIRTVKTIRLRMDTAVKFLKRFQDVKMVWFIRDPRGILLSRMKVNFISEIAHKNPGVEAELICKKIMADVRAYDAFQKSISDINDRILTIRYEDLVSQPKEIVSKVYEFIDQELPKKVLDWLDHSVNADRDDKGLFGTQRANASATAFKWRNKLSPNNIRFVSQKCQAVLERFGYPMN